MENVIWKYEIKGMRSIEMPEGAEILTVQNQNNNIVLWILVNPNAEKETRIFEVYGTGHIIQQNNKFEREYTGTCQIGEYVWHVFELIIN